MSDAAERMSRVDTAWLRHGQRRQPDDDRRRLDAAAGITHAALCERIADKLLSTTASASAWCRTRSAPAGSRTSTSTSSATWCARCSSRARADRCEALQERVGELATPFLTRATRCGSYHLIEHYDGGSAMIARIHHRIGDGIALISVVMSITDGGSEPPQRREREKPDEAHEEDWLSEAVLKPLSDITSRRSACTASGVASRWRLSHRSSRCSARSTWRASATRWSTTSARCC